MSTTVQKTPNSGRQSLFFHDLATPVSGRKGKFSSTGRAGSSMGREKFLASDPPPPPVFTLDDRANFSPECGIPDYSISPEKRTPFHFSNRDFSTPIKAKSDASTSHGASGVLQQNHQGSGDLGRWSLTKHGSEETNVGKGSPVGGVVQPCALITLPPPHEIVKPELRIGTLPYGNLEDEEWVTVYGFPPGDTNFIMREFEKCGPILHHVPGPRDANWIHILYQNKSDALKALNKSGMLINGVLIVGVKPLDPMQRAYIDRKQSNEAFTPLPPRSSGRISGLSSVKLSSRSGNLQNGSDSVPQYSGAIASPAKSMFSKVMDMVLGI